MRVTQNMISNNMLTNLMKSQSKMDKYLEQVYTGKRINRPSDDPVVAMKGMNYRTQLSEVEQYQRNTGEVNNWMDNSDAALDKATKALQRMNELAVKANNAGSLSPEDLKSIREEVLQLKEHLVDIANTNVNGNYIFNGTKTDEKPIPVDENGEIEMDNISTGQESIMIEVSNGTKMQANVKGDELFTKELFTDIDNFLGKLNGDPGEDGSLEGVNDSIEALQDNINNMVDARAELGARMNRLELVENRLEEQSVIATKTMSDNENVHFEEAITNLITQESLHRAALSAGSRIIQPTLLDFLR